MKTNNNCVVANNVAIVQGFDVPPASAMLKTEDLLNYIGTISLTVVNSKPIIEDDSSPVNSLFGSWIENGNEDLHLEELYKSRLNQSASI